jgi:CheY-like chemotaxis protein
MPEPAASLSGWKTSSRTTELAVHRRPLCREMCWTKLMSVLDVKDDDDNAKQLCSNLAALADLYRLKVRSDELSPLPLPANRHHASSLCLISTKHTKGSKGCPISPASRMHRLLTRLIVLADVIILDIGLPSLDRLQSASPGRHAQYTFCQAETSNHDVWRLRNR